MSVAADHTIVEVNHEALPFWLPGGRDNGLPDQAWVPIIDVNSEVAADVILLELKDAGVPGYTARVRQPRKHDLRRGHTDATRMRIWVGCSAYGRAEGTITRILRRLAQGSGRQIVS